VSFALFFYNVYYTFDNINKNKIKRPEFLENPQPVLAFVLAVFSQDSLGNSSIYFPEISTNVFHKIVNLHNDIMFILIFFTVFIL
jgi:hypothetical protein